MKPGDLVNVTIVVVRELPKALLFYEPDEGVTARTALKQWIPKSLVSGQIPLAGSGHRGVVQMPFWKAEELGLMWS